MVKHASKPDIVVDDSDLIKKMNRFHSVYPNIIRTAILKSMDVVGVTAVGKYMKAHQTSPDEYLGRQPRGKMAGRKGGKLLGILTGRLSRSILNQDSEFGKESIRKVTISGRSIYGEIGSDVPYAAIHEYGGQAGPNLNVTIPPRPYLNPAAKDSEPMIKEILEEHMNMITRNF